MEVVVVTGSGGLVGSEAARFYAGSADTVVGIDNDMRSYFFGPEASTGWSVKALSEAHRLIYRSKVGLDNAREILRSNHQMVPAVNHLISFIESQQEGRHGRARERRRAA